jgi:predicted Zn-dependent protease
MNSSPSFPSLARVVRRLGAGALAVGSVAAGLLAALPAPAGAGQGLTAAYARAERELPKEYFAVYTIVDRIARANGLDGKPWRILITPNYRINAYASEANLLIFEAGLLDQLEGNSSALACAIGHEMGHHVRQHLGYGPAKEQQARMEAMIAAEREKQGAVRDAQTRAFFGGILGGSTSRGSISVGDLLGGLFGGGAQRPQNVDATLAEIDRKALAAYQQRVIQIQQGQELEADESGYVYSVTAGFDPQGCIGVMDILGRMPGAQMAGSSHPPPALRTEAIKEMQTRFPPTTLRAQGKRVLASRPRLLTYEVYRSGASKGSPITMLKVFPVTGSTIDDLKRLLLQ